MEASNSPKNSLNALDWKKIGRNALVMSAGAVATVLLNQASQLVVDVDFGPYQAVIFPIITSLIEAARRYVTDHTKLQGKN